MENFRRKLLWKQSYKLLMELYDTSNLFPGFEKFGLTAQLRKAALKASSTLIKYYVYRNREQKINVLYLVMGYLDEIKVCLMLAKDLGYYHTDEDTLIDEKGFVNDNREASEKKFSKIIASTEELFLTMESLLQKHVSIASKEQA